MSDEPAKPKKRRSIAEQMRILAEAEDSILNPVLDKHRRDLLRLDNLPAVKAIRESIGSVRNVLDKLGLSEWQRDHRQNQNTMEPDEKVLLSVGEPRQLSSVEKLIKKKSSKATTKGSLEHFPTPAGTQWKDVTIKFRDGHTVQITAGDKRRIYNYIQMGIYNTRNSKPTVQWNLLYAFAEERGVIDWESKFADRKNQKRKEDLTKNLQAFFQIPGDPIMYDPEIKGYRTRFSIGHDQS
ncbi:MAG: hypothetical protein ABIF77_16930 [bacterium]